MRKNEMGFMRFCMTEFGLSSNQEFLMKIPELLHAFLPISYFEKIQGIFNVENQADLDKLKLDKKKQKERDNNSDGEEKKRDDSDATPNKYEQNVKKGMSIGGAGMLGSHVEVNEDPY
jgi:hypothetical protein